MNILVTGATGQLGYDVVRVLNNKNINCVSVGSKQLDITNENDVTVFFEKNNISHIIHCAAYTNVDGAEDNKELNYSINVNGTRNLVSVAKKYDIPIMYFSTDYVFGGEGDKPFMVDDMVNPLGEYAKSKLEGEKYVKSLNKYFIIRISWVFGINGKNFIKTMLKLSETKTELNVVSDQIGSPTYTYDLAHLVCDMIVTDKYGVYHATNEGYTSWADFARLIFKKTNKKVLVNDVTTEKYGAKAARPKNSRLDKSKLINNGFYLLPHYEDALDRFLTELGNY